VQIAYSEGDRRGLGGPVGHMYRRTLHPEPRRCSALVSSTPTSTVHGALWSLLGASVEPVSEGSTTRLRCVWPDSPLDVIIEQGGQPGTGALRFQGTCSLPADDRLGPAVDGDAPQ
jgi:hypothetical protein